MSYCNIVVLIMSAGLAFLGLVNAITIDNQLIITKNDCFERIAIGEKLLDHDVSRMLLDIATVSDCQNECSRAAADCTSLSFGIGSKGNSTCLLSRTRQTSPNIRTRDTERDPDFDLYVKKINCMSESSNEQSGHGGYEYTNPNPNYNKNDDRPSDPYNPNLNVYGGSKPNVNPSNSPDSGRPQYDNNPNVRPTYEDPYRNTIGSDKSYDDNRRKPEYGSNSPSYSDRPNERPKPGYRPIENNPNTGYGSNDPKPSYDEGRKPDYRPYENDNKSPGYGSNDPKPGYDDMNNPGYGLSRPKPGYRPFENDNPNTGYGSNDPKPSYDEGRKSDYRPYENDNKSPGYGSNDPKPGYDDLNPGYGPERPYSERRPGPNFNPYNNDNINSGYGPSGSQYPDDRPGVRPSSNYGPYDNPGYRPEKPFNDRPYYKPGAGLGSRPIRGPYDDDRRFSGYAPERPYNEYGLNSGNYPHDNKDYGLSPNKPYYDNSNVDRPRPFENPYNQQDGNKGYAPGRPYRDYGYSGPGPNSGLYNDRPDRPDYGSGGLLDGYDTNNNPNFNRPYDGPEPRPDFKPNSYGGEMAPATRPSNSYNSDHRGQHRLPQQPIISHAYNNRGGSVTSIITEIVEPRSCFRRVFAGKRLSGAFVKRSVPCERLEDCHRECAEERKFVCEGFNYRFDETLKGQGVCELVDLPLSRLDIRRNFYEDRTYDFYDWDRNASPDCKPKYWLLSSHDDTRGGYGGSHGSSWDNRRPYTDYGPPNRRPYGDHSGPSRGPSASGYGPPPRGQELEPYRPHRRPPPYIENYGYRHQDRHRGDYEGGYKVSFGGSYDRKHDSHFYEERYGPVRQHHEPYLPRYPSNNDRNFYVDTPRYIDRPPPNRFYLPETYDRNYFVERDKDRTYWGFNRYKGTQESNWASYGGTYGNFGKPDSYYGFYDPGDDRKHYKPKWYSTYEDFRKHTNFIPYRIGSQHDSYKPPSNWGRYGGTYGQNHGYGDDLKSFNYWGFNRKKYESDFDEGKYWYSSRRDPPPRRNDYNGVRRYGFIADRDESGWKYGVYHGNRFDDQQYYYHDEEPISLHQKNDCSVRSGTGLRLQKDLVRRFYSVPNIYECEKLCFLEKSFKCYSYSYRYAIPNGPPVDNCYLSDRPFYQMDLYQDMEPDRDFDVYSMNQNGRFCVKPEYDYGTQSDCFWRTKSGQRLSQSVVKETINVKSIGECELECIRSNRFTCRSFSYRYGSPVIGSPINNCHLTDWPYRELDPRVHLVPDSSHELYERGSYGHGCELNHFLILGPWTDPNKGNVIISELDSICYIGYERPAKLLPRAIRKSVRVPTESDCKAECTKKRENGPSTCMSFSYRRVTEDFPGPNCELSDIKQRDLRYSIDYIHDPDYWVFAWDRYNPRCKTSEGLTGPSGSGPGSLSPSGPDSKPIPPSGSPEKPPSGPPSGLSPSGPPSGSQSGPSAPPSGPPSGSPSGPSGPPSGPSSKPSHSDLPRPIQPLKPSAPDHSPSGGGPDYGTSGGSRPPRPRPRPPSDVPYRDPYEYRDHGGAHGYWETDSDHDGVWQHYTVNGWPCRSPCAPNEILGYWSCELAGGEVGSWDYCCRPNHRCGYSEGYDYPWCYVGPKIDQWRKCTDRYYPINLIDNIYDPKPIPKPPFENRPYLPESTERDPSFGRPSYGDSGRPPYGDSGRPPYGDSGRPSYGDSGRPPYGDLGRPSYGDSGRPPYGDSGRPPYGDSGRPPYGDSGRPPYGDSGRPPYGDSGRPPYGDSGRPPYGDSGRPPYGDSGRPPYEERPSYGDSGRPSYGDSGRPPYGDSGRPPYSDLGRPSYGESSRPPYNDPDRPSYGGSGRPPYKDSIRPSYGDSIRPTKPHHDSKPIYYEPERPSYGSHGKPCCSGNKHQVRPSHGDYLDPPKPGGFEYWPVAYLHKEPPPFTNETDHKSNTLNKPSHKQAYSALRSEDYGRYPARMISKTENSSKNNDQRYIKLNLLDPRNLTNDKYVTFDLNSLKPFISEKDKKDDKKTSVLDFELIDNVNVDGTVVDKNSQIRIDDKYSNTSSSSVNQNAKNNTSNDSNNNNKGENRKDRMVIGDSPRKLFWTGTGNLPDDFRKAIEKERASLGATL